MAQKSLHSRKRSFVFLKVGMIVLAFVALSAFIALQPAVAEHGSESTVIGIGKTQSDEVVQASDEEGALNAETLTVEGDLVAGDLTQGVKRSITVKDPDPVVYISAVDFSNPQTVAKAQTVGTLDPLPTAPRILPDVSNGWSKGTASAYSFADNDDGKGHFGTTATASGIPLSDTGLTVAVPVSQSHLIGHAVAILYGDTVIVATVTDTGGFEKYGRALDLAPGCWKALGASDIGDWGVREVYYKFL